MKTKAKFYNPDFVPFALYKLEAIGRFVDVEDIFVKCYEMAPERFGWRKHPLPEIKKCSKALRDLEKNSPGLTLKTPDGLARQLTAEGIRWVEAKSEIFADILSLRVENPPTRRPNQRLLNEFSSHPIMVAFKGGEEFVLTKHGVADLLLCSPDSPPDVWRERLETYRSSAENAKRRDVVSVLDHLFTAKPEWFGGRDE